MALPPLPFKVKTNVSWPGEEEGDLGFLENELIQVFSIVDDSWWSGKLRRNGAEGIFPKDYVEIVVEQQQFPLSSTSNLGTPTKNEYRKSGSSTPIKQNGQGPLLNYKMGGSSMNNLSSQRYSDNESDNNRGHMLAHSEIEHGYRSSQNASPKGKYTYQQQEQLLRQRELEIQHLKSVQMQMQMRTSGPTTSNGRTSASGSAVNLATSQIPHGAIRQTYSQQHLPQHITNSSYSKNSISCDDFRGKVANEHIQAQYQHSPKRTLASKVAPEPGSSLYQKDLRRIPKEQEILKEYEEIAKKRAQLEVELQKLKSGDVPAGPNYSYKLPLPSPSPPVSASPSPCPSPVKASGHNSSSINSYGTQSDENSKTRSRDDLSKKLSKYVTDEEEDAGDVIYEQPMTNYKSRPGPCTGANGGGDESPPPPPPPKHSNATANNNNNNNYNGPQGVGFHSSQSQMRIPFDGDDFKVSSHKEDNRAYVDEETYRKLYLQHEDLKSSIKSLQSDVMNLSELSATSAGSFMRHKYERGLQESQLRMSNLMIGGDDNYDDDGGAAAAGATDVSRELKSNVMDSVFEDKKKNGNIFKKMLRRSTHEQLNPIERKFKEESEIDWAAYKVDLGRMKSLTSQEKQGRTKREVRKEGNLIVRPLDYISEINTNETTTATETEDATRLEDVAYQKVQAFVDKYDVSHDFNDFISDVSMKFHKSTVNKVRCVLMHLSKFHIIEETSSISQIKPKLMEVQKKGEASVFQLNYIFKKILDALRIPCEIVLGFWKKPNEFYHNEQYFINHCWLSVLIDGNFRLVDIYNFVNASICNLRESKVNEFYFLTEPLCLVSTHIPSIIDLQHVMPPIDPNIAFYLPRTYSGFYASELQFANFNNALTRLKDLEVFELELHLPKNIELFTLVKTSKVTTNELSLCQVKWANHQRVAKIKAILPQNEQIGVLQIFAGPKGLQRHFDNIHELAIVVPLMHEGQSRQLKLVQRYPTVQSQNHDLYIVKPQTYKLIAKNPYVFEIEQYPSQGIDSRSAQMAQDFKIVIESPSGKYFKLTREDESGHSGVKPYGVYSSNIKCQEVGMYRGLVIGDSGNSWYVFAQWESVGGSVLN
ncbi:uncharacterized protein LODBEIA_P04960 [Lodderomyces beijingensis]|uniref:SH3 domain-containing protein n=1 Tax=Lodderomyces beijingensis TaxID=1775926 RepID=A0ABP0ZJC1_9ASCO